uniref:ARAD1D31064p n=1 Tax=Blastobotrys adeninivorans TaxID=409370 RepID=A0A060TGJ5_BLAAD
MTLSKKQRQEKAEKASGNVPGLGDALPKTAPSKGLSSKILEMKFMQQASAKREVEQAEEKKQKLEDASRWKLVKKKGQRAVAPTVGFSDIASDEPAVGRRSWGNYNKPVEPETSTGNDLDDDDDDDNDSRSAGPMRGPLSSTKRTKSNNGKSNKKRKK